MIIYKAKSEKYLNEDLSKTVEVFTPISGNEHNKFIGHAVIETPMGNVPVPFPIDAGTIVQAFDMFEQAFEDEVARLEEQAKEAQIVTPNKQLIV